MAIKLKEAVLQFSIPSKVVRVDTQPADEARGEHKMRQFLVRKRKEDLRAEFAQRRYYPGMVPNMIQTQREYASAMKSHPTQKREVVLFDKARISLPGKRVK